MSNLTNIEKLSDSNYDSWRVLMKSVLVTQQVWSVISEPPKEKNTEWATKDERALALITLCIQPKHFRIIKTCGTAYQAWKELERAHVKTGPASLVSVFKKLVMLRIQPGQLMQGHLDTFMELIDQLTSMDMKLPDMFLSVLLLVSLGETYDNFVVAMSSRDELPPVAVLKIKLMEEEERKKHDVELTSTVMKIQGDKKLKPRKKGGKCYQCKEYGHYIADCPKSNTKEKRNRDSAFQLRSFDGNQQMDRTSWILDSGATAHICCDARYFCKLEDVRGRTVTLADERKLKVSGIGTVKLDVSGNVITLYEVLLVPELMVNYMSVSRATYRHLKVIFTNRCAKVISRSQKSLITFNAVDSLFIKRISATKGAHVNHLCANIDLSLLHRRLGHVNVGDIEKMIKNNAVTGIRTDVASSRPCDICLKCKASQLPYQSSRTRSSRRLELVHSDLCGPIATESLGGVRYFVTFVDDYSRYVWVYPIKFKDDVVGTFKTWITEAERQTSERLKTFRTDNGLEYAKLKSYFRDKGVRHETSCAYTPQQNGVAERVNRTLVEMGRSCLSDGNHDLSLWAEAVCFAAYVRNRVINKANEKQTPFELWTGTKPDLSNLRIFGSTGYVLEKRQGKHKFSEKSQEMILVGYGDRCKGYRMLDLKTRKVKYSRDVRFIEQVNSEVSILPEASDVTCLKHNISDAVIDKIEQVTPISFDMPELSDVDEEKSSDVDEDQTEVVSVTEVTSPEVTSTEVTSEQVTETPIIKRGPGRPRKTNLPVPQKLRQPAQHNYPTRSREASLAAIKDEIIIPRDFKEALSSSYSKEWLKAMRLELKSIYKNKTWDLVKLPEKRRTIGSRWVFAVKFRNDGNIDKFKARLVARGFSQRFGIDYNQTYSPTVRPESLRLLFAIAVEMDYHIHQVDVSTAYLNGELDEEIYMEQPEGFVDEKHPDFVCKLNRSLYGLKQSGRQWNVRLHSVLTSMGLRRCETERCLYVGNVNGNKIILAVYVDDLLIASSDVGSIDIIKKKLANEFDISDKGPAKYILGIEIERSDNVIRLSQRYAIKKLLESQQMEDCKSVSTPMESNLKLEIPTDNCTSVDQQDYRSLIGSLLHLSLNTRPDITYAVNRLAQFNQCASSDHWNAARRILKYLKGTMDLCLHFERTSGEVLVGYVDADWASDKKDSKSYSGYCFKLAKGCIAWNSKKQSIVAQSSAESEYTALSEATNESTYLQQLIEEIDFGKYILRPTVIFNDNTSAIKLTENPMFHKRTKHIAIRVHNVRQQVEEGNVVIRHLGTEAMVADILTKALGRTKHEKFTSELGLRYRDGVRI